MLEIKIKEQVHPLIAIPGLGNHEAAIVQGYSGPVGSEYWIEIEGKRLSAAGDLDLEHILISNIEKKANDQIEELYRALVTKGGGGSNVGRFTGDNVQMEYYSNPFGGGGSKCLHISYHPNKSLVLRVELQTGLFVLDSPAMQGREDLFKRIQKQVNVSLISARNALLHLRSMVLHAAFLYF